MIMPLNISNFEENFEIAEPIDVRNEKQSEKAESLIKTGPITFVLVYADWCGHCHNYLPTWKEMEAMPNRKANIVSVHHDMMEKIPSIANAKIQGYPSVIKVSPSGSITEYKVPNTNEVTNAVPFMRNMDEMKKELTEVNGKEKEKEKPKTNINSNNGEVATIMPGLLKRILTPEIKGGARNMVASSFLKSLQSSTPASRFLMADGSSRRTKTYKSPKRSNRRASTRKQSACRKTFRRRL